MYALRTGVVFENTEEDGIIVDTNLGRYISLNGTASLILERLLTTQTESELLDDLRGIIEADRKTLQKDVESVVSELVELDLLEQQACQDG